MRHMAVVHFASLRRKAGKMKASEQALKEMIVTKKGAYVQVRASRASA